ncbi:MAG: response regulator transcription factor [bacterium]|nr:response regulator transcription factor [bacterium]
MDPQSILIVEDEADIQELLRHVLEKEGYAVRTAGDGEIALREVRTAPPDLLLLDLMLPGMDGLELCRRLRAAPATKTLPIVMLTARGEENDIVSGLNLGADDYITKPFSPRVLIARVQAVFRRRQEEAAGQSEAELLRRGPLTIHRGRREVLLEGRLLALTWTEFQILALLAARPGWVFTRYQIVDAVRGEDYAVTERAVDVHMVGLRRKLGVQGVLLETVRGVGYRFRDED